MKKKKTLNMDDLPNIIDIINRQDYLVLINPEQDKDGLMAFANTVACRNIREGLLNYIKEKIDNEIIPYYLFDELNEFGKKIYREKYKGIKL